MNAEALRFAMAFVDEAKERKAGLEARYEDIRARQARELQDLRIRHDNETSEVVQMLDALDKVIAFEGRNNLFAIAMEASVIKPSRQPLPEYIYRQIKLLKQVSKEDLRASAARQGFFPDGDSGGRSVHASLMNLQRGKRIREIQPDSAIYEVMPLMPDLIAEAFEHIQKAEGSPHGDADEPSD